MNLKVVFPLAGLREECEELLATGRAGAACNITSGDSASARDPELL